MMFSWINRLIGKKIASKLELTEGTVDKQWYKSKTIWAAVITAIIGVIQPVSSAFGHPIVIPQWVLDVLIGMGLYGLRTATTTIA
jgi:hypothetical protein